MGTSPAIKTLTPDVDNSLGTAYGDGMAGWRSQIVDVNGYDEVTLLGHLSTPGTETTLNMRVEVFKQGSSNGHVALKVGSDGNAAEDVVNVPVASLVASRFSLRLNTLGIYAIRISFKGDVGDGNLDAELSMDGTKTNTPQK